MKTPLLASILLWSISTTATAAPPIPDVPREYRVAWCATVQNIDWPTAMGQSQNTQKNRLRAHMDALVAANMNAMYLQIRPACDAFYASDIEPWSLWLTGTQGNSPGYDPLAFAISEARTRGLELHAWINPYRASMDTLTSNKAANHVTRTSPTLIRQHSGRLWLDPGREESISHTKAVLRDIVTRYDVDGIALDDYFYPGTDFPDSATYDAYVSAGGTMSLADWRRNNVDTMIREASELVHSIRPGCQFEVGPFGIWQPGYPEGVSGANYYRDHYCDSRKWLRQGWVDSLSPQIYWALASSGQPYGDLMDWWVSQNVAGRLVLASNADYKLVSDPTNFPTAYEIVNQVKRTRQAGGHGNVHYSMKHITDDYSGQSGPGVRTALMEEVYAQQALRPATPWLDNVPPAAPLVTFGDLQGTPAKRQITFAKPNGTEDVRWWCVHTWDGTTWTLKILPGNAGSYQVGPEVQDFAITAVDRAGNESTRTQMTVPVTLSHFEIGAAPAIRERTISRM